MVLDIQWGMLPAASANLGNALVNASGQIAQRETRARDRRAITNYLNNPGGASQMTSGDPRHRRVRIDPVTQEPIPDPDDPFMRLVERNPEMAFRLRDEQTQRIRGLRTDQQAMLRQAGELLRDVTDDASYQRALAAGRMAQIDITGAPPTYDPNWVGQVRAAAGALTPRTPEEEYTLGRGDIRYRGGREIARGAAPPAQVVAVAPGGTAEVIEQAWPGASSPPSDAPPLAASSAPRRPGEAPAFATPTPAPGVDEPALRAQAEAAIRAGRNPELVWRRYQELLTGGGAAPQGQQTFP